MKASLSWLPRFFKGNRLPLLAGCLCLLVAAFSPPVLAHGTKVHKKPDPAQIVETVDDQPSVVETVPEPEPAVVAEPVHDHSAHGPNEFMYESGYGQALVWLGRLHPAVVHFPIGLLIAAALAELLSLRFHSGFFGSAGRFCLWIGAIGALSAATLGWFYGGFRLADTELVLTVHRWNGTGITVLALLALWLGERRVRGTSGSFSFRTILLATAVMAGLNGYSGGFMVYGPEQHQWPVELPEHLR